MSAWFDAEMMVLSGGKVSKVSIDWHEVLTLYWITEGHHDQGFEDRRIHIRMAMPAVR
jgi:hypothetical protein